MGRRAGATATVAAIIALTLHWHTTRLDAAASVTPLDRELVSWLNNERTWNRVAPVAIDGDLAAQAQLQAQRMADCRCLFHTPPGEFGWWLNRGWHELAENVGGTTGTGIEALYGIHLAFILSPGHRDNMLNPRHDAVGIAVRTSTDGRQYIAQFYGGV